MSLTVNTNVTAMAAANSLNSTQGSLSHSLARISSGMRVTKAADDAAGLAVATNLSTQARSGKQAIRNANDGISVIQTAEAAADEVLNILDRMRELAVQSASETLEDGERAYLDSEYTDLESEIDRIAAATEFNGISLGTGTTLAVHVGTGASTSTDQVTATFGDLQASSLAIDTATVGLDTAANALTAITAIDVAIDSVNSIRSDYGSVQNRLDSAIGNMTAYVEALTAASSQIVDADYATETAEMTRLQVMQQAGVAALAQAKSMNQSVISLLG